MERNLYKELLSWQKDTKRKPLLLQGARQVGKTYLVKSFGHAEYSNYVYLNFEQNPVLESLFRDSLKPQQIIDNISLYIGQKIEPADSLIFFDEIQIAPRVLTSLKYFCEEAPEYHIIAAGSLLGVSIGKQSSFPVGKVNFMTLYPMSFSEYLKAFGEGILVEKLLNLKKIEPLADIIHQKLLVHLKMYLYLGGMPEVLQDYLDNRDIAASRKIQNEILEAYQRDFSKYTDKSQAIKTSEFWQSIPRQLAKESKKFKYSDVRKRARSSTFEQTIEWLKKAGLIHVVYHVSSPRFPLTAYADYSKFKVYLHDTGLLGAMLGISSAIILESRDFFSEYKGAFIENFVASELKASGIQHLFYWTSKRESEVDYIIQSGDTVYPLEVKSGLNRNIKSLRNYASKYSPKLIYRSSPRNFIRADDFINIPLYASFLMSNPIS